MSQALLIITIIAIYFGLLLLVSHFTSRGANNATYFTGNRNIAWPIVALAMLTAPISGLTFISVPGMVFTKGYGYLQMCMGFVVGYMIIAWVLVPLFYKHNIISIYSFLEQRFGTSAYKTGAWLFLISEVLGIGVRFMVVCVVLQLLVFAPLNLPFVINVLVTMSLIWLYTARGGVKSVIWSDTLKSLCLLFSLFICIYFITKGLNMNIGDLPDKILNHESSRVFHTDDIMDSAYFWKQFITGIFLVVAMTGLDQDLMQRILACKNYKDSRKNLIVSGILQFVVISLFLVLGSILLLYMENYGIDFPEKTDDIFATVAFHKEMPTVVSIFFILGLISASYSSVGSALTSLTTSYTVDIMEGIKKYNEAELKIKRKRVHCSMALIMAMVILGCYYLNHQDAISALFTLASYTYGPILGLFVFGIYSKKQVSAKWIPMVCLSAPVISWLTGRMLNGLWGYDTGYEIFLINALVTILGLYTLPLANEKADSQHPVILNRKI